MFPGFIDTHTHLEMNKGKPNETADGWASGTLAALAGGTTTVLDFAEPERGASLASALETWHGRAEGASCHYGFHMTIKNWNSNLRAELADMDRAGVASYKVYFAYDNLRVSDGTALEVVRAVGERGYLPVPNPDAAQGQSVSVRLGLSRLTDLDGVMFCVCDQPWLRRDSVERLLADFSAHPDRICSLSWKGERGSPAVFPRDLFPELLALTGDRGGGGVIRAHRDRLRLVEAYRSEELQDMDTPFDLEQPTGEEKKTCFEPIL